MSTTEKRMRRGGRAARKRSARQRTLDIMPYIRNNVPCTELLSEEALQVIEHNADTILQEVGMEFRGDHTLVHLHLASGTRLEAKVQNSQAESGLGNNDEVEVGYNANYLQEVLKHIEGDDARFLLGSPVGAAVVKAADEPEDEEYMCLLMPLRLSA